MSSSLKCKSVVVVMVFLFGSVVFGQPWAGSGDANDPYQIWTAEDMQAIGADANYWDAHFLLMADINLSAYTGTSFNIIGTYPYYPVGGIAFTGVFDGNGHTISNFTCDSNGIDYIGLFGCIYDLKAEVKNLGLIAPNVNAGSGDFVGPLVGYFRRGTISDCYAESGSVKGDDSVGGLVGYLQSGTISDCYVESGSVSGRYYVGGLVGNNSGAILGCYSMVEVTGKTRVGGLVGRNYKGYIKGCYSTGSVTAESTYAGGLVGNNDWCYIRESYSTGEVAGRNGVGGLVGHTLGNDISDCYSTGSVTGVESVGGLVGEIYYGHILSCYSTGSVTGEGAVGGLVGDTCSGLVGDNMGGMSNCYSTGEVSGEEYVGGLVGWNSIHVFSCYSTGSVAGDSNVGGLVGHDSDGCYGPSFWDNDVNPDVNGIGNGSDPDVIGLPTVLMQTESTFTDAGWDFVGEVINGMEDIWQMCDLPDYPKLWWEVCPVVLEMEITPAMLNCESEGKWVKAHVILPEGYWPEDIDVNTPAAAEPMGVESEYIKVFDNGKGKFEVEIGFDREAFCAAGLESEDGYLDVTVTGWLLTGQRFEGTDTIKVISQRWRHRERITTIRRGIREIRRK